MSDWFGRSTIEEVLKNDIKGFDWFAVRTRSRSEKKLSLDLKNEKIRYYLPLYSKATLSGRAMVTRELPLFSGYIFIYLDYELKMLVEDNKSAASFLKVNQVNSFLKELNDIERLLVSSKCVAPVDYFRIGQRVRVVKGPMEGIEGEIQRFKNKFILVLKATAIGLAVSMEINATDTEPLTAV